ncbi:hypothetical protein FIBSPDRAFT_860396, partial [Athelia psychrophila]
MCKDEAGRAGEPQARKDTRSHDREQTLGEILHSESACLSPLPPAWSFEMTLVSEDPVPLGSSPRLLLTWTGPSHDAR